MAVHSTNHALTAVIMILKDRNSLHIKIKMIYWNMYLPNVLVVYTLMKNIFYLESIKSDGFKIILKLTYCYYIFNIFQEIK